MSIPQNPASNPSNTPEKVILAYSGGLDTTTIVPWLKENYEMEVIAVCIDVGQGKETDGLEEKAIATGASKAMILDVTEEFVQDYCWPAVQAGAIYEGQYLLGTALARPLIAKKLVEVALAEGATAICHGATGKGNDQVRFELAVKALAPQLKIIAPWRIWDLKSREDEMAYLEERGIPVPMKKDDSYSRDENLWHVSHEGLELEDPALEPNYDKILKKCKTPEQAPDTPTYLEITFTEGIPTHLNGDALSPAQMLSQLNTLGGLNAVGVIDMVENRLVGMKSRGIYETPGGTILYKAHETLEHITLDKATTGAKLQMAQKYAELLYDGLYFTPLREAVQAFIETTQKNVTGTVKLKLYKGNITPAGVESPYSLYNEELASFDTGELFDHHDAEGFINLYGLPYQVQGMVKNKAQQQENTPGGISHLESVTPSCPTANV